MYSVAPASEPHRQPTRAAANHRNRTNDFARSPRTSFGPKSFRLDSHTEIRSLIRNTMLRSVRTVLLLNFQTPVRDKLCDANAQNERTKACGNPSAQIPLWRTDEIVRKTADETNMLDTHCAASIFKYAFVKDATDTGTVAVASTTTMTTSTCSSFLSRLSVCVCVCVVLFVCLVLCFVC